MKEYNFRSRKKHKKSDFGIIKPDFGGYISERNESFQREKTNFTKSYIQKQNRKNFLNFAFLIVLCIP